MCIKEVVGSYFRSFSRVAAVGSFLCFAPVSQAEFEGFHFKAGLTYVSGFSDVVDLYEDALNLDASTISGIGIQVNTHYGFEHGSRVGLTLGPIGVILGDADFYDIPLTVSYGFNLFPESGVSPFARVGYAYHFVSGDLDPQSDGGLVFSGGVEFNRDSRVGFGFEIGVDTTEIEFEDVGVELETQDVFVSVFAIF